MAGIMSKTGVHLSDLAVGERYLNTGGSDGFFILTDVSPADGEMMQVTVRSKEGKDTCTFDTCEVSVFAERRFSIRP